MQTAFDKKPWLLLATGILLIALSHVSTSAGFLAWVAPIPFLRYLRVTRGWRARAKLAGALLLAWALAVFKIASEPFFFAFAPVFSVPIALAQIAAYLAWDALRTRVPAYLSAPIFAIAIALEEWVLHALTPFGTWGATACSQLDDLPLLQLASVFGVAGIGIVVNLAAAWIEEALAEPARRNRALAQAAAVAAVAHFGGAARLAYAGLEEPDSIAVAAIRTDSSFRGLPLPSREATRVWDLALHDRTRRAAQAGAELVVWTEAATLVRREDEDEWTRALSELARESRVDVMAGYIVPTSTQPVAYRNEYRLALSDGTVLPAYAKFHPVPGEPATPGTDPAPIVRRHYGNLSGAICYDYDFPGMALARARRGADIVAIPSSDWRGIDPVHGQMAVLRAIEGGHSLIRSARWGLSVAADAHGRIRAWQSAFEPGPDIMLASVPRARTFTLYALWGDAPLFAATSAVALLALLARARRRRAERRVNVPA